MSDYTSISIRNYYILGQFIGKRVVDITEADPDEEERFVMLMFEDGSALKFPVTAEGLRMINVEAPDA